MRRGLHQIGWLGGSHQSQLLPLVKEGGSRQHGKAENLQTVGIQGDGIVDAFLEARQSVAGQPVDEVEAEGDSRLVQQGYFLGEFLAVDAAGHQFEDFWMGALEADLQGAGNLGK